MLEGMKVERVTITDKLANDIFQTAIDAGYTFGIGYWGQIKIVHRVQPSEAINSILVHETEKPRRKRLLDKGTLENGMAAALSSGYKIDSLDGSMSDIIIQFAMFGELVYG